MNQDESQHIAEGEKIKNNNSNWLMCRKKMICGISAVNPV